MQTVLCGCRRERRRLTSGECVSRPSLQLGLVIDLVVCQRSASAIGPGGDLCLVIDKLRVSRSQEGLLWRRWAHGSTLLDALGVLLALMVKRYLAHKVPAAALPPLRNRLAIDLLLLAPLPVDLQLAGPAPKQAVQAVRWAALRAEPVPFVALDRGPSILLDHELVRRQAAVVEC